MKRLLLIWSGHSDGTSANLFRSLNAKLAKVSQTRVSSNTIGYSNPLQKLFHNVLDNVVRIPSIVWSDAVIVHSYAVLSAISILAARALRKRVVIIHWDIYPTTMRGERRDGAIRRLADILESEVVKLATTVVIPSRDFRDFVCHKRLVEMPLWPSIPPLEYTGHDKPDILRVAFVGQLDPSRGLDDFVRFVRDEVTEPIQLHIFSGKQRLSLSESDIPSNLKVVYHPQMKREQIQEHISSMELGLVSLSPNLDQPGYPSKTFDYVAANLPIIYFGRPLPDYCKLLQESGVGEVIDVGNSDLRVIHSRLIEKWASSRAEFYARTEVDLDRFFRSTQI